MMPQKVACAMIALSRGNKDVLQALGGNVPEGWIVRDKRVQGAEKGEYDLSLEEPEEGEDLDELFAQSLDAEVALSFDAETAQRRWRWYDGDGGDEGCFTYCDRHHSIRNLTLSKNV